ncbi:MAG: hypothetical protein IPK83_08505 [Planctomycetes bacterium]|nr:hypothetical protein [Planctomycetota bacterium]
MNNFTFDLGLVHAAASDLVAPLIAALVICDWRGRLDDGRRGVVSLGSAMWLAIFGYIAAKIADADEVAVMAILAGASLGVQSLGGLWPMQVGPKSGKKKNHGNDGDASAFAGGQNQGYAATVAVSRDGLNNRMAQNRFAANGNSPMHGAERTSLPQRSSVVRSIWFIAAGILGLASVLCYIALGVMNMPSDEWVGTLIGGVALSHFTIFALSCAAPRLQKGAVAWHLPQGHLFCGIGDYIGLRHLHWAVQSAT